MPLSTAALSIATWNINSVRLRIDLVARFLGERRPDVLCLQETKCRDAEFPLSAFHKLGYPHVEISGQKGYHGVAIASRLPLFDVDKRSFCDKEDCRHLAASLLPDGAARPLRLHNFYVPAGGDEPDPLINPKFAHKLAFLDEMAAWMKESAVAAEDAMLVGDLNVAPLEQDVWSHKALLRVVSHTPIEVEKFGVMQEAGPWVDAMRRFVPEHEKLYTWWSYRAREWEASDRGRRLDHVLVSDSLAPRLRGVSVEKGARSWDRPSDHAPVIVTLDV
ncbi:exodeoxyribonuclease III [Methylocella sp.]|uniref:exodeoxyribonuclease III n=1 Tax=Methylocella sp. TaxID=1978226 RepID=UPI0035B17A0C